MAPVQLYVYDLSNGMARNLSFQLTGKQIDGIWHTSVVVFGKEVYYGPYNAGPGIQITQPGRSHHGRPMKVENMGDTAIDEDTFLEYINEIQEQYTGDKYHLLDFNCNSFTNDCVGFLTGGSIPTWIKDLPSEFMSTPFGQSMRPMIDNMYRRPLPAGAPVLTQAPALPIGASAANAATLTSPIQISTNPSAFNALLKSNKIVVAFFTSDTCAPCKMIEPVFKEIVEQKNGPGVAFAEVNLSAGMSQMIAQQFKIAATPTFLFFLDGAKVSELKGVNAPELRTQVDLLFFEAFPPHPHTKLDLPAIRAVDLAPILFSTPPPFDGLGTKLTSFINACPAVKDKAAHTSALSKPILPALKGRFPALTPGTNKPATVPQPLSPTLYTQFAQITRALLDSLPPSDLFPIVDLWRIAVLDGNLAKWLALSSTRGDALATDVTTMIFESIQRIHDFQPQGVPRNLLLTALRLASNCFATQDLQRHVLTPSPMKSSSVSPRSLLTSILIPALLHEESSTRVAAASLTFNLAFSVQKPLMEKAKTGKPDFDRAGSMGDGEWEVEIISALVEALGREKVNEEVVHRLVASLAFFIHLSPHYEDSILPLLEVLQVKEVLEQKMQPGGCGDKGVTKGDVRKLIHEVVRLCPES